MSKQEIYVEAECVCCGATRKIKAGEIPEGEQPCCEQCYGPMIAKKAVGGSE